MTKATLFVCSLCRFSATESKRDGVSGGEYFIDRLQTELKKRDLQAAIDLQPLRCMAACRQSCNATLAAPDRLTFILSKLSPTEAAAALSEFCEQYIACSNGKVPYKQRSSTIREATSFILPPLPSSK